MNIRPLAPDLWAITEYFAGHATPEGARAIEGWRDAAPEHGREFEALWTAWRQTGPVVGTLDTVAERQAWLTLVRQIRRDAAADIEKAPSSGVSTRKKSARPVLHGIGAVATQPLRRGVWYAVAGLFAVLVTVVSWRSGARHASQLAAASLMTYTTGNGERATIALPDGGVVVLNVASRLEVPMDYLAGHRTIRLVGEGLFTVPHHDGAPLTVVAGGVAARVLGTSFVVRHYATDTTTMVAVRDGKVAVGAMALTANQLVEVGRGGVSGVRTSDAASFTFASGTLTIAGLALPAAIVELDRWYDADIRLADPVLAKRHVKATFGAGSLGELAEILELMYDVRVVRDGRVLTLYPK